MRDPFLVGLFEAAKEEEEEEVGIVIETDKGDKEVERPTVSVVAEERNEGEGGEGLGVISFDLSSCSGVNKVVVVAAAMVEGMTSLFWLVAGIIFESSIS